MSDKIQVIKAVAFWCDPHRVNKMAGKYTIDLSRLNDAQVAAFRKVGATVNFDTKRAPDHPDHQGYYVKLKSETPITPVDMAGKPLPDNLKIGNGSVVHAGFRINQFTLKSTGKAVTSLKWLNLKVQELVKYDPEVASRAEADRLLDQVSGEGFMFGEEAGETGFDSDEADALFKDAS